MQSIPIRILSGDIGGTKTRLAVITVDGARLHMEREQTYASRDYAVFEELLGEFLQGSDIPARAVPDPHADPPARRGGAAAF